MNINFKDKTILVTGGSEGIGKQIVLDFLKLNGKVIIIDKKKPKFLNKKYNLKNVNFFKTDFSKNKDVDQLFKKLSNISVDVLINNARYKQKKNNKNFSIENFQIDFYFHLFLTEKLIKIALRNKKPFKICNISSISSKLISDQPVSYHVSKSSINTITKYFSVKYGKKNININAVLPGLIIQKRYYKKFNSLKNYNYKKKIMNVLPFSRFGTEDDVSNTILFLSSKFSDFINGETIILDGGASNRDQFSVALDSDV